MMLANKTIRAEFFEACWEGTPKSFCHLDTFSRVVNAHPPREYNWISKVELDFNLSQWFEFFGIKILGLHVHVTEADFKGPLLKSIPTLKVLKLTFQNPRTTLNPWETFYKENRQDTALFPPGGWQENMTRWPCNKQVIDWVLNTAFDHIRHIPHIRLEGCIKTVIKSKRQSRPVEAYNLRNEPETSLSFEHDRD